MNSDLNNRSIMAVVAHPDDESYGIGGTLARYSAEGADVYVVVATDGAAGSVADNWNGDYSKLSEVRAKELQEAADILGVRFYMLDYRDSGYIGDPANDHPDAFINTDREEAVRRLVTLIRKWRPLVVITHDETGNYSHPDHIFCHEITVAAFHAAGDAQKYPEIGPQPYAPARLYFQIFPKSRARLFVWAMRLRGHDPKRIGRNHDVDATKFGVPDDQVTTIIDFRDYWDLKVEASAAHESQGAGSSLNRLFPSFVRKYLLGKEFYSRGYPPLKNSAKEKDLFEGF